MTFIKFMSMCTLLALVYIHMQMQIFDLAYQGKVKANSIVKLLEENSMVQYAILEMTSSNHLGLKLLNDNSTLKFRDRDNVVELVTADVVTERARSRRLVSDDNRHPLLSWLPRPNEAEARTIDRKNIIKPWKRVR